MSNAELPASLLVFFYVLIIIICIGVVGVVVVVAPDLFRYFKDNQQDMGRVYKCNKHLDEGNARLYEECMRAEIKK